MTIGMLILGIGIGWFVWGTTKPEQQLQTNNGHMMPDGTMMGGSDSAMSAMMDDMNAALRGKTGDTFDKEFLAEMIVHHQGAIDMAQLALTNAKHQEIKDLANTIIKAQTSEIAQMKMWQKNWYSQ